MKLLLNFSALLLFISISALQSNAQEKVNYKVACMGFYNLENLFDYEDDTTIWDEEYMPNGAKAWDAVKYATKLNHMAKVISEIGTFYTPDGAAVLGVCEVENKRVLEDLVKDPQISERNYHIVHYDSPDRRGIDVGLLYQEKYFKLKSSKSYILNMPDNPEYKTRNQIVVTGNMDGEDVSLIVAHWPSRRGGQAASEKNRIEAAKLGRRIIDSLYNDNPQAKIILMGDLNDDPINIAVTDYIKAKGKKSKVGDTDMYNTMYTKFKKGIGTLAYRDSWNLFDQIIISKAMISADAATYVLHKAEVFSKPYMINPKGNYKGYPLRTHAGGAYQNGYSDHFPTYIILKKIAK
jgi:predicted extracellular nuclease